MSSQFMAFDPLSLLPRATGLDPVNRAVFSGVNEPPVWIRTRNAILDRI